MAQGRSDKKKGKRKVQGVPQSQIAALHRSQEEAYKFIDDTERSFKGED